LNHSTRIAETFAVLKARNQMAFMPFITAGDPDMAATLAVIRELARRGVDLIEVGFPYSDPIADGPVIQASYTRALGAGLHVREIFAGIKSLTAEAGEYQGADAPRSPLTLPPLVAMVSYAIVFRTGPETFMTQARDAGFSGLIVPDLPGDEAEALADLARRQEMDLVQLISPTTPPARAERILQVARGFVYCISVAGTTGVRDELPAALADQLRWLREQTDLPLAVGFGISRAEQVASLRGLADGVIVGSGIVRQLEALGDSSADREQVLERVGLFAAGMVAAAHA
jgi:tryptophan synthase alpha chain